MKNTLLPLIALMLMSSCATIIDPNSKKAFYNDDNRDIVWNQKVFSLNGIKRQYDAELMFTDNIQAQDAIKEVNQIRSEGTKVFWITIGSFLGYATITTRETRINALYYSLIGLSIASSIYYNRRAEDKTLKSLDEYNKKMNYTFSPYIFRENNRQKLGLAFTHFF